MVLYMSKVFRTNRENGESILKFPSTEFIEKFVRDHIDDQDLLDGMRLDLRDHVRITTESLEFFDKFVEEVKNEKK